MITKEAFDSIQPEPVKTISDHRGSLFKVLCASSMESPKAFGEIYLVTLQKGAKRGQHYHIQTTEWFFPMDGEVECALCVPDRGWKKNLILNAKNPCVLKAPKGVAHSFLAIKDKAVILAYADLEYDQDHPDVTPLIPG